MNYIQFSAVKIIVSGRVQGVGYRYFIARFADSLDIKGYAKNLFSGEVEITAEGRREFLDALVEKAGKGPTGAMVKTCKVEWLDFKKKYDKFEIL
ncbi:MAG: acylphosphatase [Ignavibacteria bacterium]|nr:acylphosphatase [Ignavibacteria bacterium]